MHYAGKRIEYTGMPSLVHDPTLRAKEACMRKYVAAALLALIALPAQADNIDLFAVTGSTSALTLVLAPPPGNQPQNIQCLICGTNQPGQQGDFGYNNYAQTGNATSFIEFSSSTVGAKLDQNVIGTGYNLSFLQTYLLSQNALNTAGAFSIGIDVNTATGAGPEVLEAFVILNLTQMTVIAQYSLFDPGGTALPTFNNGTGFPDYLLTNIQLDRGDIAIGDQIVFAARWSNASDGAESFFLVPNVAAVPGPVVGMGLPGLIVAMGGLIALARRRRNHNSVVGAV